MLGLMVSGVLLSKAVFAFLSIDGGMGFAGAGFSALWGWRLCFSQKRFGVLPVPKKQFVFFDLEQPLILFFTEYIAMMGLWACIAYYVGRVFQQFCKEK